MQKTILQSPDLPRPAGAYSQAVRAGSLLFISGQIALDPKDGQLVPGGIEAEARQALDNLNAVLRAGGSSLSHVLKVTVYLLDMQEFSTFNSIYTSYFSKDFPARATVAVAALPRGARIEVDAVALIPDAE